MKKILSFAVVICLLLSSCLLFASCSKVSEKKMEKDPFTVLSSAMETTTSQFFADDAKIGPTIAKAMQNGSLSISLEAELLKELEIGKITETLYMNQKNKKIISDTLVNYNGENLSARIFIDQNGIILNSTSLLGSDISYGLFPSTLEEKFTSSKIAEAMGLTDEETITQVNEVLSAVADAYKKMFEMKEDESAEMANKLLAALEMTISEQELTNEDGKAYDCIVASYQFNNATYEAYMKLMLEEMDVSSENLPVSIDDVLADMSESMDIDLTISMFVNKKKGNLEKLSVAGSITETSTKESIEIDASLLFSATAINMSVAVVEGEENMTITADLTKEDTDDSVTYQFLAKAKRSGTSVTFADLTYNYVKDSGNFNITLEIPEVIEEDVVIKGKVSSAKDTATISITSVEYDNVEVEMKLDITFNANAKIPQTPANVKDVVDLTEADIEKFMEDFRSSKLGELIFSENKEAIVA